MSLTASAGSTFLPVPQGNHVGRCYRVIDLGTQASEYKGKARKSRKVMLAWELFGEDETGAALTMNDGRPLSISKRYTISLSEKAALRADLESWRGRAFTEDELAGFDLQKLLDIYALINVTHTSRDGTVYANVASISPLPRAMRDHRPPPINVNQYFEVTEPDMELFATFSDRLRETIGACAEWNVENVNAAARGGRDSDGSDSIDGMESDLPF